MNQVLQYSLAYAAQRFEIEIHCACFMSSHYHLVLTDPKVRLPEFMGWFNANVARCLNLHHGRRESLWASGSYSSVELPTAETILEKMVYTLANPVAAGLVASSSEWPGATTRAEESGGISWTAKRPDFYFSRKMPKEVTLSLAKPPGFDDMSLDALRTTFSQALTVREAEIRTEAEAKRAEFQGRDKVLAASPLERATSEEEVGAVRPRVAGRDSSVVKGVLDRLKAFYEAYWEALRLYRAGFRDAEFPAGTYWMRVFFGARCRASPG